MALDFSAITLRKVTPDDAALDDVLPDIARAQAAAHDTRLPDKPEHALRITQNFRSVLERGEVEIWRTDNPVTGAVFLSPLSYGGRQGIQMDDVVVLPAFRGQGYGAALITLAATIATARHKSFVAWECEDGNPAAKTYAALGAVRRAGVKPFRLTKAHLAALMRPAPAQVQAGAQAATSLQMTVSPRFSLFRTVNYGIEGYDLPADERANGIQIEDLTFEDAKTAIAALSASLYRLYHEKHIQFADLVLQTDHPAHAALARHFDAAQNSYSGSPAALWVLEGDAFAAAAQRGWRLDIRGILS